MTTAQMLYNGLEDLTYEQLQAKIKEESEKDPEEIDMDYVDFCFRLLEQKKPQAKKHVRYSMKITLAVAAVLIVLVSSFGALAGFRSQKTDNFVQVKNGNVIVDWSVENAKTTATSHGLTDTEMGKQIQTLGISPITVPEELTKENGTINEIQNTTADATLSTEVTVSFRYLNYDGQLVLTQYSQAYEKAGKTTLSDVIHSRSIQVNGMDVLLFEQKDRCIIQYKDGLTYYKITLSHADIDTALQLAQSIR